MPSAGPPEELDATVRTSGPDRGSAVTDAGTEVAFSAAAVDPRLRVLHRGQRVRLRRVEGVVRSVTLVSLPEPAG